MRLSRRWIRCAAATAVLAMASVPTIGFTEELFAGVSWSVIEDPGQLAELQAPMVIGQHLSEDQQAGPSPTWLDLNGGRSRAANREPDLGRYEF